MTVGALAEKDGFSAAALPDAERIIGGGRCGDLLSFVMSHGHPGDAWITVRSNENALAVATLTDAACVVLAERVEADDALTRLALEKGVNLLTSPFSVYEAAWRLEALLRAEGLPRREA